MIPQVTALIRSLFVSWADFIEPLDHEFYEIFVGEASPPATKFTTTGGKQVTIIGLTPGTKYYVQVFAFDCFGAGQGSGIVEGIPLEDTAEDGSASGAQVGSVALTLTAKDIISVRFDVVLGHVIYFWACMNFTSNVGAGLGSLQVVRRVPGGGGNPPPVLLRESFMQVASSGERLTGHVSGIDFPPSGDWEYVLQAYGSVSGMVGLNGYVDILIKR